MADYIVKFVAQIVESQRPDGFPRMVESDLVVRVNSLESLKIATNEKLNHIIRNQGMVIIKDPSAMRTAEFKPDAAYFIPMHMIAYIDTVTKKLAADIPEDQAKKDTLLA